MQIKSTHESADHLKNHLVRQLAESPYHSVNEHHGKSKKTENRVDYNRPDKPRTDDLGMDRLHEFAVHDALVRRILTRSDKS